MLAPSPSTSAMSSLEPPATIGRYELSQALGSDHTGDHHEAVVHGPLTLRRIVTLRCLPTPLVVEPAQLQAARSYTLLSHPNLTPTLDLSRIDDAWVVALAQLPGPSLAQLRERAALPASALIDVAVQLATALDHVHGFTVGGEPAGLIHGDVRPTVLHLAPGGLVQLSELGVAALLGYPGSPGLAAPEQRDGAAGPGTDLYGLATTLLWLATGQPPADPQDPGAQLSELAALEPGLAELIERCLLPDPQQRGTAGELLGALQTLQVASPPDRSLAQLLGPSEPPASDPASPRTNLSPPPRPLIGRQRELSALEAALDEASLVCLFGPVGVGKTRLALELALARSPELEGGSWYLDLRSEPAPDVLCSQLGQLLGVDLDPHDPAQQLGATLAARSPILLVLDHADDRNEGLVPLLSGWLDQAPALRILLVSREPVPEAQPQPLGIPPLDEAVALFQACTELPIEDESLVVLVERLGRLPLALVLAAAQDPLPRGLPEGADHQSTLNAILALSWNQLALPAQLVLPQLSVFCGGLTPPAAGILELSPSPEGIGDVLEQLGRLGLIQLVPGTERLELIDVVRAPVEAQLASPDRARLERRHGDFYAQLQQRVSPLRGSPLRGDEPQHLLAERANLQVALDRALARGDVRIATDTALALAETWRRLGLPQRATEALYHALTLDPVADDEVQLRCGIATAVRVLGPSPGAEESKRALALAAFLEDPSLEALALWSCGTTLFDQGDLQLARSHIERASALASAMGQRLLLGRTLADLGKVYHALQRQPDAASRLDRALELARTTTDPLTELEVLLAQSLVLPPEPAAAALDDALALAVALDRRSLQGTIRARLGALALERADHAEAIAQLTRATELHHLDGAHNHWALACAGLGSALTRAGQTAHAQRVLSRALEITEAHGLIEAQARVRASLAEAALAREQLQRALEHVEAASALLSDAPPSPLSWSLALLRASIHRYGGELEAAESLAQQIRDQAPDPTLGARAELELARLGVIRRQGARSLEHIEEAQRLLDEAEHASDRLLALGVKAAALLVEGQNAQGEAILREAEDRAVALGLPSEGTVQRELRRVRGAFGPRSA